MRIFRNNLGLRVVMLLEFRFLDDNPDKINDPIPDWWKKPFTNSSRKHKATIIKQLGGEACLEFHNVSDTMNFAVSIQQEVKSQNASKPEAKRLRCEMGAHLCEVDLDGDEKTSSRYKDDMSYAAQLSAKAMKAGTGSIYVTSSIFEIISTRPLEFNCEFVEEWHIPFNDLTINIYRLIYPG